MTSVMWESLVCIGGHLGEKFADNHFALLFIYIDWEQQRDTISCLAFQLSNYVYTRQCTCVPILSFIGIGMNKMAEGDKYLDYIDKMLEWTAKSWGAFLGAFLKTKWWGLNSLYTQQLKPITFTKTPRHYQSAKNLFATKNTPVLLLRPRVKQVLLVGDGVLCALSL